MIETVIIWVVAFLVILFLILAKFRRVVPNNFADVVIQGNKKTVYSSNTEYSKEGKAAYFKIPEWFFPFNLGMVVHRVPLEIMSINVPDFLAFDTNRVRFVCNIVAYIFVKDPELAAQKFAGNMDKVKSEIFKIVQSTTRDATTKRTIREIINNREGIISTISPPLRKTIEPFGLDLNNVELVEFRDPTTSERPGEEPSHVISDISSIAEVEVNSEMRQKNAEQEKSARLKEAESDERARLREIERDEVTRKREQDLLKEVAEKTKIAKEAELEVERVKQVQKQDIEKERAIVEAKQKEAVEQINKRQKKLEGEGDRDRALEKAKGTAAPIRETGFAEAEAKKKLQEALSGFDDTSIQAMIAREVVEKDKAVGIAVAEALSKGDLKVFAGGGEGKAGFDLAQLIGAVKQCGDDSTVTSLLNRIARPNETVSIHTNSLGKKKPTEKKPKTKGA
jgi:regulator of protease activity HflC (stomatin/prohibitin superfamily)